MSTILSGDKLKVLRSISVNTGLALQKRTASTVDANVKTGTIISSPGSRFSVRTARCRAAVPLLNETAYFTPIKSPSSPSNSEALVPPVSQREFKASTTVFLSSSVIHGTKKGRFTFIFNLLSTEIPNV